MASERAPSGRGPRRSRYKAGEFVRIKSAEEIAATLDHEGTLNALPFMPEMIRFSGRAFKVRASAHKTCDNVNESGMRSMDAAVHLEGLHCDGSGHGGCQSRCPLFWRDAWLEPAPAPDESGGSLSRRSEDEHDASTDRGVDQLRHKAARSVLLRGRNPSIGTYSCQSTEVLAATVLLPSWSPRQYWDDVRSGNITVAALLRGLPVILFNKYQGLSRRFFPRPLLIRDGRPYPETAGTLQETPDLRLGIAAGEIVEVRPHAEILATLDTRGKNRGLGLDPDMVRFCGQRATVRHRVENRIDERTGELKRMNNPCLVLDGIACQGSHHRFCPRAIDSYWREIWLTRVEPGLAGPSATHRSGPPGVDPSV
jgi:hypothetical protein